MKSNLNKVHVEGRIYQHSLEVKTVKNTESKNYGQSYIQGKIELAIDEAGLEVIPVEFTYVTPKTSKGGDNRTYSVLSKIMESGKTIVKDGILEATKLKVDTALALNDFFTDTGLVSQVILQGGFVDTVSELNADVAERAKFDLDMVVTGTRRVEADPEKMIDADYLEVRGAAFNFRNALLPVTLVMRDPMGIQFFESQEISNAQPLYTELRGTLDYSTKVKEIPVEGAFGGPAVDTKRHSVKDWVINWARKVPYDFGDENILTMEDLSKASQEREVYLAEKKKNREEYLAKKQTATNAFQTASVAAAAPTPMANIPVGSFKF